jgi:hypothetical protein
MNKYCIKRLDLCIRRKDVQKAMHSFLKEKKTWPENKHRKKTKNSRRTAAKFVSIINTAVASNAEVCVRPEEFDGTW